MTAGHERSGSRGNWRVMQAEVAIKQALRGDRKVIAAVLVAAFRRTSEPGAYTG